MKDILDFYTNAPLLELGAAADKVRREKHPEGVVTYIVDRNINYTNVCVADCGFCAFYRRPKHAEGWTLSYEQIGAKIDEAKEMGAIQILMQGGHNPYIPFEWYLDLLRYIKTYHPIHIHGFSPVSYTHLRAHETPEHLVCRLLLEKKKKKIPKRKH